MGGGIGLVTAVSALALWSVPASSRVGDLDLGAELSASGALTASRSQIIDARPVRPGRPAVATVGVRNQSGRRLGVRLRATGPRTEMDGRLAVRVVAGRRVVFSGPLGELRGGSDRRFALDSGERRDLRVAVGIRAGVRDGWAGRYERLRLRLQEEPLQ